MGEMEMKKMKRIIAEYGVRDQMTSSSLPPLYLRSSFCSLFCFEVNLSTYLDIFLLPIPFHSLNKGPFYHQTLTFVFHLNSHWFLVLLVLLDFATAGILLPYPPSPLPNH